jgi:hypothetical protein
MKISLSLLTLTFLLSPLVAQDQRNDWLLIPDSRIGPITTHWTGADLIKAFGTLHCHLKDLPERWEGGESRKGYLLYPGTADELEVYLGADGTVESVELSTRTLFIDPKTGEFVESKRAVGKTRWHSISGITVGSTIEFVEKVNGKSFHVEGWETEGGGMTEWKGGNIPASFEVTFSYDDVDAYQRFYEKTMTPGTTYNGDSASAPMRELAPIVHYIRVTL